MANSATAASISLKIAERSRYPFGSIQNFSASAMRKRHGTQVARESNIGGSVKSNAAANQSNGTRGILLSLLVLLLLMLMPFELKETQCPQALVKMRLPNSRWNFSAWKTKTVRTLRALSFNYPKRELRQPFFPIG